MATRLKTVSAMHGANVHVTEYGGLPGAMCIQLTIEDGSGDGYVQLEREGVRKLVKCLKRWLDGRGDL